MYSCCIACVAAACLPVLAGGDNNNGSNNSKSRNNNDDGDDDDARATGAELDAAIETALKARGGCWRLLSCARTPNPHSPHLQVQRARERRQRLRLHGGDDGYLPLDANKDNDADGDRVESTLVRDARCIAVCVRVAVMLSDARVQVAEDEHDLEMDDSGAAVLQTRTRTFGDVRCGTRSCVRRHIGSRATQPPHAHMCVP